MSPRHEPRADSARRWFAPTVLGIVSAGLVMFFATARSWAVGQVRAEGLPTDGLAVTGNQAQPLVGALALVVAAGGLAVLSTRGRPRQAVGVLISASAAMIGGLVLTGRGAVRSAFDQAVSESTAFTGENQPAPDVTWWPWLVLAAAVIALLLGVATVIHARTWPSMGRRYDAPNAPSEDRVDAESDSGSDVWKAIDEGRDPTV